MQNRCVKNGVLQHETKYLYPIYQLTEIALPDYSVMKVNDSLHILPDNFFVLGYSG